MTLAVIASTRLCEVGIDLRRGLWTSCATDGTTTQDVTEAGNAVAVDLLG